MTAKLSYSNVMATVAVFIALGGTSYAAITITGKNVKNNSLTSADMRNGSLLGADFKPGQLPAGPQGPAGPTGPTGPAGATGSQGAQGEQGETGATGAACLPSNPACVGPKGDKGDPGPAARKVQRRLQPLDGGWTDELFFLGSRQFGDNAPRLSAQCRTSSLNAAATNFVLRLDVPAGATASAVANTTYTSMLAGAGPVAGQNGAVDSPGGAVQDLINQDVTSDWRRFEGQAILEDGSGGVFLVFFHAVAWAADHDCDVTGVVIATQ